VEKIKFGTDGWRAIIAQDYTVDNVKRVAMATGKWVIEQGGKQVVVGHDCRFGGLMFTKTTAAVLASQGIKVLMSKEFVSTPMVSLAVLKTGSKLGVVITASHNPPSYNGFKLKSSFGGPTIPKDIAAVEALIEDIIPSGIQDFEFYESQGLIDYIDMEEMYFKHVEENFDLELIRKSGIKIGYDAMYGAGQRILPRILPNAVLLHCDNNPSFMGQAPEPILKNLTGLSAMVRMSDELSAGLANDGDADRIGMFDEHGEFVDSHQILLLLLHYLAKEKGMSGKVVITFSVTDKMKKLADYFGMEYMVTPIGFKYIAEIMIHEDVIVGGEESGGLAVKGHIPERDGIWIGLTLIEYMARTGKTLSQLVQEVFKITGPFAFDRDDLHISNDQKIKVIKACEAGEYSKLGKRDIIRTEQIDGYKFYLSEEEWVMVRPSGTEPVLRVYAQAPDMIQVRNILDEAQKTLLG
jgi:phosphomannomutase